MLDANSQIYWMPGHLKDGRFGKWLEGARGLGNFEKTDTGAIRYRYGSATAAMKTDCLGSRAELEEKTGKKGR